MKTVLKIFVAATVLTGTMTQCDSLSPEPGKGIDISLDTKFADATGTFAFDFLKTLENEEKDKNFFVSPLSLHIALGMLLNGSDGSSEEQIIKTLKLEGIDRNIINNSYNNLIENLANVDPKVKNLLANSVWQREGFPVEQSFTNYMKETFKAGVYQEPFDAGTLKKINQWANDNTNGKIKEVLDNIDGNMVMFLINALYFKGDWAQQFDKKYTEKLNFSTGGQVDMMSQTHVYPYVQMQGYKALDMPYGDGNYLMRILLPDDGDVHSLINTLDLSAWKSISEKQQPVKVDLKLPKFKMEYDKNLNATLSAMGMPIVFTSLADLSKISPPAGKIQVAFVKQNAFIETDEKGSEAAAVTTIGAGVTSAGPSSNVRFFCNKPFVFIIYEKSSGTIQFAGKLIKPAV
jgi:serine protease inhibitor